MKLTPSRTIQTQKPITMSKDEPNMFSNPYYDEADSDGGEPNVVDITDDFDNNS
jgi:hypothetical protein